MKVIVISGSRSWPESEPGPIADALRGSEALIVGDATGVDAIALRLALEWDVILLTDRPGTQCFVAEWDLFADPDRRKAGPARNARMVQRAMVERDAGMEVTCFAYPLPGSIGTWDCVKQLRKARFEVCVWGSPSVGENLALF